MPTYDYRCGQCDRIVEVRHAMGDKPVEHCSDCGTVLKRVYTPFNLGHGCSVVKTKVNDWQRNVGEIQQDMRENYGVEKFKPLRGANIFEVYNDLKQNGAAVKDQFQRQKETGEANRAQKAKEWKAAAQKRAPQRRREMAERKAAEAFARKSIRIS
jgi:putative FmdB family regulatory protein